MGVGPKLNPLAIVSLVLGVISLPSCFCCGFGVVAPIPGIICGIIGLSQFNKNPQSFAPNTKLFCIIGICLCGIGLLLNIAGWFTTWDEAFRENYGHM